MPKLELIKTNLRRYTFQNKKMKQWVEENSHGKVLNLFAGKTRLNLDEIRNDIDPDADAKFNYDALDFVRKWKEKRPNQKFNTIILDPPYSYRKSMEMYNGNYTSRFRLIADTIPAISTTDVSVISFGYHSTFLGEQRRFNLDKMCIFAHGGAQHVTIAIIEKRRKYKNMV